MRRRNLKKKAVIEVGFSWIFILIAGAVILGLFAYIGVNQGNFFTTMFRANLLTDLNAIFIGALVSKDTAAIFNVPKTTLNFDCTSYSIGGIAHPIEGKLVFGPDEMTTNELVTWSKPWSLGFRISNMLYITSPYIKYIIAYDDSARSLAQSMYDDLPSQLTKELLPLNGSERIVQENYEKVVVLVLGKGSTYTMPTTIYNPNEFREGQITFLYLLNSGMIGSTFTGNLMFKNRNQQIQKRWDLFTEKDFQGTYDISYIYGAFISGNQEVWQCVMDRGYLKAKDVARVYEFRAGMLGERSSSAICLGHYTSAVELYDVMHRNLGYVDTNGRYVVSISDLRNNIIALDALNGQLERSSCPLLY